MHVSTGQPSRVRKARWCHTLRQMFLQFKAVYPFFDQSSSTPAADYGSSTLPVTLTPPQSGSTPSATSSLVSAQGVLGEAPHAMISLSSPASISAIASGHLQVWTLVIQQSDIQNLASSLWNATTGFLNPDVIDDLFLVCQYAAG